MRPASRSVRLLAALGGRGLRRRRRGSGGGSRGRGRRRRARDWAGRRGGGGGRRGGLLPAESTAEIRGQPWHVRHSWDVGVLLRIGLCMAGSEQLAEVFREHLASVPHM